ncbi:MAG: ribosomal L7Ae/L30e/S12e/Gadd45 family protein [Gemmatimonadetes bacterium]|nr:ribosomal L7Ae/L30e/S12e/Gadd45 family protein [Gemmatimonadota bacterium]
MAKSEAVLRLLGLAARAGAVLPGTQRVREAVRGGALRLVIVAADASPNSRAKLLPLLEQRRVQHLVGFSRSELGWAVGRGPLSALGVTDAALAGRLRQLAEGQGSG